jgi:DNA-binding LacI/PurR family transcriptional regulator
MCKCAAHDLTHDPGAGPGDVQSAQLREAAFVAAAAGRPVPPVARGAFTPAGGEQVATALLTAHPDVTSEHSFRA